MSFFSHSLKHKLIFTIPKLLSLSHYSITFYSRFLLNLINSHSQFAFSFYLLLFLISSQFLTLTLMFWSHSYLLSTLIYLYLLTPFSSYSNIICFVNMIFKYLKIILISLNYSDLFSSQFIPLIWLCLFLPNPLNCPFSYYLNSILISQFDFHSVSYLTS